MRYLGVIVTLLAVACGPAFENADVPDHAHIDDYNTLLAIKTMQQMARAGKLGSLEDDGGGRAQHDS